MIVFITGDSGYGLEPWLMTPVLNAAEGTPEFRYTQAHCSARNTVERTIGVLKSVLSMLDKRSSAALFFVLHLYSLQVYNYIKCNNNKLKRRFVLWKLLINVSNGSLCTSVI